MKRADQKGNSYEERINAKTVNPHNSPFIGLMALNTPISPGDGHPQRSSRLGNRGGGRDNVFLKSEVLCRYKVVPDRNFGIGGKAIDIK